MWLFPCFNRLSEILEEEREKYIRKNPDPFDKSLLSDTDSDYQLAHMLKFFTRKSDFITRLFNDYLREDYFRGDYYLRDHFFTLKRSKSLNLAACRLLLALIYVIPAQIRQMFQVSYRTNLNARKVWLVFIVLSSSHFADGT